MSQHLERPEGGRQEAGAGSRKNISALSASCLLPPPLLPSATCSCLPYFSPTLASLPLGARLILRCRKDWRAATVVAINPEHVTLSVASPSGHTYRVRRPAAAVINFDGPIAILGDGSWRAGFVRYDVRW